MEKTIITLPEIKLVGIATITNDKKSLSSTIPKVGDIIDIFFKKNLQEKINNRKTPGKIFSVFTNYENKSNGNYTYFIGEEVYAFKANNKVLKNIIIPPQRYVKFTSTTQAPLAYLMTTMWQNIYLMSDEELGGTRSYLIDFETYGEEYDPLNPSIQIYIGIK